MKRESDRDRGKPDGDAPVSKSVLNDKRKSEALNLMFPVSVCFVHHVEDLIMSVSFETILRFTGVPASS